MKSLMAHPGRRRVNSLAEPDNGHSVAVAPAIVGPHPHRAMLEKPLHVALKLLDVSLQSHLLIREWQLKTTTPRYVRQR